MALLRLVRHADHDGERADVHERVHEQVEEHARRGSRIGRSQGQEEIPPVGDARVGQHPLHVGLHQRNEIRRDHGDRGKPPQDGEPGGVRVVEGDQEDTRKGYEGGCLYRCRHERGHRRRRTLVDVGRPHVEGHRRDLEREANHQERDGDRQQARSGGTARDTRGDDRNVGTARGAVGQRDSIEEEPRRERTQQEVFEPGLGRLAIAPVERGERVHGDRHDLESQEDDDQVARACHEHRAGRREQDQSKELTSLEPLPIHVGERNQNRERDG